VIGDCAHAQVSTPPGFAESLDYTALSHRIVAESRSPCTICTRAQASTSLSKNREPSAAPVRGPTRCFRRRCGEGRPVRRLDSSGIGAVTEYPKAECPRERVHRLTNLGGLVALADLPARRPPRGDRAAPASQQQPNPGAGATRGHPPARAEREKRTWTVHRRAESLHQVRLSTHELHVVLPALGAPPGADPRGPVGSLRARSRACGERGRRK
jgi:hypothetical protein